MHRTSLVIVTPALADANNGNWQTAHRWARMLAPAYRVVLTDRWPLTGPLTGPDGGPVSGQARRQADGQPGAQVDETALMIALHARRSAPSMVAWRAAQPQRPLLLVLTGTDLYRDIDQDADAQASLSHADALLVLNERGPLRLAPEHRVKCQVVLQSCSQRRTLPKTGRHLRALMVGHLRDEKDPLTYLRAAERLAHRADIHLDHIGAALDPALGAAAQALAARQPRYRWLGALPHSAVRRQIQQAHVLVHASRMEGGAHVVIEALRSGTPVIGSQIDGNLGLLGSDYTGTFPVGDDAALAALLLQARDDADMLPDLKRQGDLRAPLFTPEAEAATLHRIVAGLLEP